MPEFTYSACSPFTKNKERIQNLCKQNIYQNDLDKAYFQHDMTYGGYKILIERTKSKKILRDKSLKVVNDPKYNDYGRRLVSMFNKFLNKKSSGSGAKCTPNH